MQVQQKSPNTLTVPQSSPSTTFSQEPLQESITQAGDKKRKKQRRVYPPRTTPYETRQRGIIAIKKKSLKNFLFFFFFLFKICK